MSFEVSSKRDQNGSQSSSAKHTSFVAVDWGTTSLRLWCLSAKGQVTHHFNGPLGMSGLEKHEFEPVLEEQLASLSVNQNVPVVICGMAGAAQGWHEAPYVTSPATVAELSAHAIKVPGTERDVYILPGVKQLTPSNVMRGEETQLSGLLAEQKDFDGVVCLPGTHSKWIRLRDSQVEHFTTCMTGEIFGLLSKESVLKHSIVDDGFDTEAFIQALCKVIDSPASFADSLFSLRADKLLAELSSAQARARLSGLLVGLELAATRSYWENNCVVLLGDASLCAHYAQALSLKSISVDVVDSEKATLAGLYAAFQHIRSTRL